jgi:signal peptidase I
MSPSSTDNTEPLAVMAGGHQNRADHAASSAATRAGRHARAATRHPGPVRSFRRPDYRLRSLDIQPKDVVPPTPKRTDGQRRRRRRLPRLISASVLLAVAALAAVLVQGFVIQPFSVPGNAMTPTFKAGDRILVVKSGVLAGPIRKGEIVVFRPRRSLPCTVVGGSGGDLVLRVVALPGDTIWSVDSAVFVDGRPLRDLGWYDARFGELGSTPIVGTKLRQGQYFVMADNRSDACDSRAFGPISKSSIVGEGIAIVGRYGHIYLRTL